MLYNLFQYEKNICFNVWDLGLTNLQIEKFRKMYILLTKNKKDIVLLFDLFNYSKYPSYFNIKKKMGEYAWKSIIISTVYYRFKKPLLWLDAGCYIKGSLQNIYEKIKKHLIYAIGAGSSIKTYTYIKTLIYLNASTTIYNKLMCAGGVVGLFFPSSKVDNILQKWVFCSLNKECIAPNLSNRSNHRQDQSVLSIILYQNNFNCYNVRLYNFSTHFDRSYHKYNNSNYNNILKLLN